MLSQVSDKGKLGVGYETHLILPKHPIQCDEICIDGAVFRRVSPPIKPLSEYCDICKQTPCRNGHP